MSSSIGGSTPSIGSRLSRLKRSVRSHPSKPRIQNSTSTAPRARSAPESRFTARSSPHSAVPTLDTAKATSVQTRRSLPPSGTLACPSPRKDRAYELSGQEEHLHLREVLRAHRDGGSRRRRDPLHDRVQMHRRLQRHDEIQHVSSFRPVNEVWLGMVSARRSI